MKCNFSMPFNISGALFRKFCQLQRKLIWSILKEMPKLPWIKRTLMARERKETTIKTTKKLVLWYVSESEEHKQIWFALRSCWINGWRNRIAVKIGNWHKSISVKTFALNFQIQKIFTKILTCRKLKNVSIAKICWLFPHFLMLHSK